MSSRTPKPEAGTAASSVSPTEQTFESAEYWRGVAHHFEASTKFWQELCQDTQTKAAKATQEAKQLQLDLEAKLKELQHNLGDALSRLECIEPRFKEAQQRADLAERKVKALQEQYQEVAKQSSTSQGLLKTIEAKNKELEKEARSQKTMANSLSNQITQIRKEAREAEERATRAENKHRELLKKRKGDSSAKKPPPKRAPKCPDQKPTPQSLDAVLVKIGQFHTEASNVPTGPKNRVLEVIDAED